MRAAIYARVSTIKQDYVRQQVELQAYAMRSGMQVSEYLETGSGKAGGKRPELERLMADARLKKFDCVLVWHIDRFGRSLTDFLNNVLALDRLGIRFIAPNQNIDTDKRNPFNTLLMQMLAVFAEFERNIIVERVRSGVAEAKRMGKHCGRPQKVFRKDEASRLRFEGMSFRAIARELDVPESTIRRTLRGVKV